MKSKHLFLTSVLITFIYSILILTNKETTHIFYKLISMTECYLSTSFLLTVIHINKLYDIKKDRKNLLILSTPAIIFNFIYFAKALFLKESNSLNNYIVGFIEAYIITGMTVFSLWLVLVFIIFSFQAFSSLDKLDEIVDKCILFIKI